MCKGQRLNTDYPEGCGAIWPFPESNVFPRWSVKGPPAQPCPAGAAVLVLLAEDLERKRLREGCISDHDLRWTDAPRSEYLSIVEIQKWQIIRDFKNGEGTPGIREKRCFEHALGPLGEIAERFADRTGSSPG